MEEKNTLDEETDKYNSDLSISEEYYKELHTLLINRIQEAGNFKYIFKTDKEEILYFFPNDKNIEKQYNIYNHISELICLMEYLDLMDTIILGLKSEYLDYLKENYLNKICEDFLTDYSDRDETYFPKYICYNNDALKHKIEIVKEKYDIKLKL